MLRQKKTLLSKIRYLALKEQIFLSEKRLKNELKRLRSRLKDRLKTPKGCFRRLRSRLKDGLKRYKGLCRRRFKRLRKLGMKLKNAFSRLKETMFALKRKTRNINYKERKMLKNMSAGLKNREAVAHHQMMKLTKLIYFIVSLEALYFMCCFIKNG